MNIEDVEGIGADHATSLRAIGIATTDVLLERGATPAGRAEIAANAGLSEKLVLEWVNHVDLMRIDGVGSEYSDLLEAAGVDSPAELAQRNAANLAQTFQELDAARPDWIRSLPSQATVEKWITQARTLPKIVTHGGGSAGGAPEVGGESGAAAPVMPQVPTDVAAGGATQPAAFAAPADAAPAGSSAPRGAAPGEGIWARIKRFFGV